MRRFFIEMRKCRSAAGMQALPYVQGVQCNGNDAEDRVAFLRVIVQQVGETVDIAVLDGVLHQQVPVLIQVLCHGKTGLHRLEVTGIDLFAGIVEEAMHDLVNTW